LDDILHSSDIVVVAQVLMSSVFICISVFVIFINFFFVCLFGLKSPVGGKTLK